MAKKTPDRVRLTEAKLLDYSAEHVYYEIALFLCQYRFVLSKIDWDLPAPESVPKHLRGWTVNMALLEALLIHARLLTNFLYPQSIQADDVIAADFFDDPEQWDKIRPRLPERLDEMRKRADKEVAHLTTRRISGTPPEKSYHLEGFAKLWEVVRLFAMHASPSRLHQRVRDVVLPQEQPA